MTVASLDMASTSAVAIAKRVIASGSGVSASDAATLLEFRESVASPRHAGGSSEDQRLASAAFHAAALAAAISQRLSGNPAERRPVDHARTRYHARMLGFALAPQHADFRPLVTVLIPVFNRAGPLVEAVQSCLDQTWQPVEVLVIDDGSEDGPESGLAQFGDRVRMVRQANRGVASARNLGVSLARGDFIHFLDSDDLLLPRAIESKIEIYGTHPDAELCYGQAEGMDMRKSPPVLREARITALDNPSRSMIVAFPFLLQQAMMPRWRVLAAAPFEEDLRRSSDFRFWQSLAFAGIKVAGSPEVTTRLRRFHDSLHLTPEQQDDSHAVALLRGLRDLLGHTSSWPYGIDYMNILAAERARYWFEAARSDRVKQALYEVLTAICEYRGNPDGSSLSMLPLLAAFRERIGDFARRGEWPAGDPAGTYAMLSEAIGRAIKESPSISDRDFAFWTQEPAALPISRELPRFFATLNASRAHGAALSLADHLLRSAPRIPRPKQVKRAARLSLFLGSRLTGRLVGRWMER